MSRVVELKDTSPLVIKKEEMEDDTVFICRCGLSDDWPYCDSSHAATRDEESRVKYHREDGELVREDASEVTDADPRA